MRQLEARLIDDLLDLTRSTTAGSTCAGDHRRTHVPIRHALDVCDPDLRAKALALEVDLAAEDSHVAFDPARLEQVTWNLIKNAVKFTPAGGRVAVRTQRRQTGCRRAAMADP